MNRPGASANAPATTAPAIVPIMNPACRRMRPVRTATIATAMLNRVHTVSPWIQLNAPEFISRIQNEDTVTHSIAATQSVPTMRWRCVPLASARFAVPSLRASSVAKLPPRQAARLRG